MNSMRFRDVFAGRRIFVNGHTNFAGGWLSLFLETLGAEICGLSNPRRNDSLHYSLLNVEMLNHEGETGDFEKVRKLIDHFRPSLVFHTAGEDTETLIRAACEASSVEGVVILETKKRSNAVGTYEKPLAFCRVEELIGGGDFTKGRLFPELYNAAAGGVAARIHGEGGVRGWHHVLEAVAGCVQLGCALLDDGERNSGVWKLDAGMKSEATTETMVSLAFREWKAIRTESISEYASDRMFLEMEPKRPIPGLPTWSLEESVKETVEWYRAYHETGKVKTLEQLEKYISRAAMGNNLSRRAG